METIFFRPGDRVKHALFGYGTVIKDFLLYCEVKFDTITTIRTIAKDKLIKEC